MTFQQIQDLLELLPQASIQGEVAPWMDPSVMPDNGADCIRQALNEANRYAMAYADLQFGWRWLQLIIRGDHEFTPAMRRACDPVMRRAHSHLTRQRHDPYVMNALMIGTCEEMRHTRQMLNALFLSRDYDPKKVCQYVNLPPEAVDTYEKLFFNVVDRRADDKFIATVLYPNTRIVELFEDYLASDSADLSQLMMRAGYNNGMRDVLFFAGHADGIGLLADEQAKETPARLESLTMANGFILARNGWLNVRRNAVGVQNARALISAAKIGGQESEGMASPMGTLGDTLTQAMITFKRSGALAIAHKTEKLTK